MRFLPRVHLRGQTAGDEPDIVDRQQLLSDK
jgi:hypothetical protein